MKKYLFTSYIFLILLVVFSCANRGSPSGGEKDVTPPVILKEKPANYSVNFNADEIRINFDEYIKFDKLREQLVISPPLKNEPVISPRSLADKYIRIKLKDTLKENTTYSINFGSSIVDNNEGNPYPYYNYVFSTGSYIDSLFVKGIVKDALAEETEKYNSILLYEVDSTYTDSIIYKSKPKYVTSTLDTLSFNAKNLKEGKYKLIALKEKNVNYKYDYKTDKIGFQDGFITLPEDQDKLFNLKLYLEDPSYKMVRAVQRSNSSLIFGYEGESKGDEIELIYPKDLNYRLVKQKETDSLDFWFKNAPDLDSLAFNVKKGDFNKPFNLNLRDKKKVKDSLIISLDSKKDLGFFDDFKLTSSVPIEIFDKTKFEVFDKDSMMVGFVPELDKLNNVLSLKFEKLESQNYNINLYPGAITDFLGQQNDTLSFKSSTRLKDDYGSVRIALKN